MQSPPQHTFRLRFHAPIIIPLSKPRNRTRFWIWTISRSFFLGSFLGRKNWEMYIYIYILYIYPLIDILCILYTYIYMLIVLDIDVYFYILIITIYLQFTQSTNPNPLNCEVTGRINDDCIASMSPPKS